MFILIILGYNVYNVGYVKAQTKFLKNARKCNSTRLGPSICYVSGLTGNLIKYQIFQALSIKDSTSDHIFKKAIAFLNFSRETIID